MNKSLRALCSADLHINNNTILGKPRLPVCKRLLQALVEKAVEHKCSHIFLLGDVWHAKHPAPEVVLSIYEFLEEARANNLKVVILLGNHDVFQPGEDNQSLLRIFNSGLASIVDKPRVSRLPCGVDLYMLPWYESDTYKARIHEVTQEIRKTGTQGRRRILMTHVGLSEGKPSLSNFQPPQRVSLTDLDLDLWDQVLMGDYHMHQKLAPHAMYLGSPIPHTFGDEGNVGFWLLVECGSVISPGFHLTQVPVGDWVPRFERLTVTSLSGIHIPYDKKNYNRIECVPELYERVRKMYPEAEVLPLPFEVQVDTSSSRISVEALDDYPLLVEEYLRLRGVKPAQKILLKEAGLALLQKARAS